MEESDIVVIKNEWWATYLSDVDRGATKKRWLDRKTEYMVTSVGYCPGLKERAVTLAGMPSNIKFACFIFQVVLAARDFDIQKLCQEGNSNA